MAKHVVSISVNSTMTEAADLLTERRVSGAPVVDEAGRCVGVLTGSDFVHQHAVHCNEEDSGSGVLSEALSSRFWDESQDMVRKHMTVAVQTIHRERPLLEAARMMCSQHVHRLIVVDDSQRPAGVISSLDMAAVLLKLAEEHS
jgi:predicted transcriptional regulator